MMACHSPAPLGWEREPRWGKTPAPRGAVAVPPAPVAIAVLLGPARGCSAPLLAGTSGHGVEVHLPHNAHPVWKPGGWEMLLRAPVAPGVV